jgi:hypothetical protein
MQVRPHGWNASSDQVKKDDRPSLVEGQFYSDTNLCIDNLHLADAGYTSPGMLLLTR